jgi:hypothetical protein
MNGPKHRPYGVKDKVLRTSCSEKAFTIPRMRASEDEQVPGPPISVAAAEGPPGEAEVSETPPAEGSVLLRPREA